jgi:hypothetical protein
MPAGLHQMETHKDGITSKVTRDQLYSSQLAIQLKNHVNKCLIRTGILNIPKTKS